MDEFENRLDRIIRKTALEVFGIRALKPFQSLIIHNILSHSDEDISEQSAMLAVLPTGGGKSLCFMLPALLCSGITIITYPLLALMEDQGRRFREAGIPYAVLKGGQSQEERNEVFSLLASGKVRILITNIETLSQQKILDTLKDMKISLLVADEAHTLITWGEGFRPAFLEFPHIIEELQPAELLAFTATCDNHTRIGIENLLHPLKIKIIYGGLDRENIVYHRIFSLFSSEDIREILEKPESRPAIVFTTSRRDTEYLAKRLSPFFPLKYYHAGLEKEERKFIEKWFADRSDAVLVSTCAYGMGVDKKNIRSVIHYSLPDTASEYLQESGRAGRDGRQSHAYALIRSGEDSPLLSIFKGEACIRRELIRAMGRGLDTACAGCDVCDSVEIRPYGYDYIMKRIRRLPFFYTAESISSLIARKSGGRITNQEAKSAIRYLISEKKISTLLKRLYLSKNSCGRIR